ncbi:MAG: hypothetical protein GY731_19440, partial [Gammaproteobacteria bacterium]|nr:hypothetical protein [Gammaproteobacteria bacterium]
METIAGQILIWRDNPEDEEPMSTIRRSFHTLKGSGRLVGATEIGELAWHIERMLNRVLDGAVVLNPAMLDLVDEVYECLPALVEGFKQGIKGAVNVQELMERADTLGNQVVVTPDGGSDDGGTSSSKGGVSNAATGGAGAEVEEREPEGIPESPPEDGSIGGPQDGDQDEPQDEDGEFEDPSVVSSGSDQGVHTRLEPA